MSLLSGGDVVVVVVVVVLLRKNERNLEAGDSFNFDLEDDLALEIGASAVARSESTSPILLSNSLSSTLQLSVLPLHSLSLIRP